jgi:hypothetical protein
LNSFDLRAYSRPDEGMDCGKTLLRPSRRKRLFLAKGGKIEARGDL